MIRLGLVGYPVEHSLSPVLHQAALRAFGEPGEYALYRVRPADTTALQILVEQVRGGEIQGLNITIPHKQAIVGLLDELSPAARAIGAVNTVYRKDGKAFGENTDFAGFRNDLCRWLPAVKSSVVLGAGGAARAIVFALGTIGCEVSVASRRLGSARELAGQFAKVNATELEAEALLEMDVDLLVNATPAGMFPQIGTCAWPAGQPLPQEAAIYDLVYNPPETRLIKEARAAGLRATNGLGMLIEQAALAFEIWTGYLPPRGLLIEALGQAAV